MLVRQDIPFQSTLRAIGKPLLSVALSSALAVWLYQGERLTWLQVNATTLTILGSVLGVFLAFRNNESFNRYWEARTLWGTLVNASRTLTRQVITLIESGNREEAQETRELRRDLLYRHLAFVNALRAVLRDQDSVTPSIEPFLPKSLIEELTHRRSVPAALLVEMGRLSQQARRRNWLSEHRNQLLDDTLGTLADVLGGCEKIKNTPLPRGYTYFSHMLVRVYCVVLPFGLVSDLRLMTPVAALLISFTLLVLDRNGHYVETPFGHNDNDLPLMSLSRNIEIDIRQELGEQNIPPVIEPVNGVLL